MHSLTLLPKPESSASFEEVNQHIQGLLEPFRISNERCDIPIFASSGDFGRAAIEGVGIMRGEDKLPEVGVILFNMGAVDKHLYSEVANMKLDVSGMYIFWKALNLLEH